MDSVIRGHHTYKILHRALGKDFTGTALFAASVAELGSEDRPVLAEYSLSSPLWRFQYI